MIHTVIFDIGNTLIESRDIFEELLRRIGSENKEMLDFMKKRFFDIYRNMESREFLNVPDIISIVLRDASKEFGTADISQQARNIYEENFLNNSRLFDGVSSVMEELKKRNICMIAASDADKDVLLKELKSFGIFNFFDEIIISSEVKSYKPSDKMVSEIQNVCKEPASEILFVGDSEVDLITAKKMGTKSVLISRNNAELNVNPDYRISSLKEIIDILYIPHLYQGEKHDRPMKK